MDRTVKVIVIFFVVAGFALFGYHWLNQRHARALEQAIEQEKNDCLERIALLEAQIQKLSDEVLVQNPGMLTKSEMAEVFGAAIPEETDCAKVTSQVAAFFKYLDSKVDLIWPGMTLSAEELFKELYSGLISEPPVNVGEMENLHSLLRNVTHLYRVLGKDRIELLKTILLSESAVVEPAMAVMHTWLIVCSSGPAPDTNIRHLKEVYPYAVFFLNTLGGRSYLLRRDSKVRMLVTYYATLIVDLANDHKLNTHGLDIRPHVDYLSYDINSQKGLMYRERYIAQLANLKHKYPSS